MSVTVDLRCPACNQLVKGGKNTAAVAELRRVPRVTSCQHCGTDVVPKQSVQSFGALGSLTLHYFSRKGA